MNLDIAMTTYNRSEVLKTSLRSLARTKTDGVHNLYIFDDCSTDPQVESMLEQFSREARGKFSISIIKNKSNLGCDLNMCQAINHAFRESNKQFVITIDSDVVYNCNWISVMESSYSETISNPQIAAISLYDSRSHCVTGTYNEFFNIKSSIGGLCALLNRDVFQSMKTAQSWDWEFVRITRERNMLLLCSKNSFIQHIGNFGEHSPNGVMYDFSTTFIGEDTAI